MKKPIIIILAALLALPATAWVGEVFSSREGGTLLYYTIIDEDANTCITSPGTDEDDPGNSVRKSLVIPEKVTYATAQSTATGRKFSIISIRLDWWDLPRPLFLRHVPSSITI